MIVSFKQFIYFMIFSYVFVMRGARPLFWADVGVSGLQADSKRDRRLFILGRFFTSWERQAESASPVPSWPAEHSTYLVWRLWGGFAYVIVSSQVKNLNRHIRM